MARDAVSERDLRQRLSIPPTFDVAEHLRTLRQVFVPCLIGALVIAGAVYLYVAARPAVYESVVVAKIDFGATASMTDVTVNTLAPPFVALSQSRPVLEGVLKRTGVDMTPEDLAKDIVVSVQTSPSLVQVSARAGSPVTAVALSSATVSALDDSIINIWIDKATKDIADLQTSAADTAAKMGAFPQGSPQWDVLKGDYDSQVERARQLQANPPTRIGLLSQPYTATQVAPMPAQQTMVAFVVALLALLEAAAFFNGRIGGRSNKAWVRRNAAQHGYAVERVESSAETWPTKTQILLNKIDRDKGMLVLYSDDSIAASVFVKRAVEASMLSSVASVLTIESDWWRDAEIAQRSLAVVVIDTAGSDRAGFVRAFKALDDYGLPVQIVTMARSTNEGRLGQLLDKLTRRLPRHRRT